MAEKKKSTTKKNVKKTPVVEEKKLTKKELKIEAKNKIVEEKAKYEVEIDKLIEERSNTQDKKKIKEINEEIKNLKQKRSMVGKKKKDTFLGDVKEEMKLVRWPTRLEVLKYSIATIVFVLFFAGFFFLINVIFALIQRLVG